MVEGKVYRHSYPGCTYDICIIKILHANEERIKARISYISKASGHFEGFDKVRILTKDFNNWTEINRKTQS